MPLKMSLITVILQYHTRGWYDHVLWLSSPHTAPLQALPEYQHIEQHRFPNHQRQHGTRNKGKWNMGYVSTLSVATLACIQSVIQADSNALTLSSKTVASWPSRGCFVMGSTG